MKRAAYLALVTAVLAMILHIVIVLLIPAYATRDAWAKLEQVGEPWKFSLVALPDQKSALIPQADPAFGVAACRYDLSQAALSVSAGGDLPFWSVAIFDRRGRNIYSFNDRTAIGRQLNLLVVDPVQLARLRKNPVSETEQAVVVETQSPTGFVLIRVLQSDPSWTDAALAFLAQATCEKFLIE